LKGPVSESFCSGAGPFAFSRDSSLGPERVSRLEEATMELPEQIVKWVRGDLGDRAFEQWVYASVPLLDAALGQERAMVSFSSPLRDPPPVADLTA
jgi:hypothetical protein